MLHFHGTYWIAFGEVYLLIRVSLSIQVFLDKNDQSKYLVIRT